MSDMETRTPLDRWRSGYAAGLFVGIWIAMDLGLALWLRSPLPMLGALFPILLACWALFVDPQ
jgi:hypothetical protein